MKLNVTFKENSETLGMPMREMQPVTVLDSPAFTGIPTAPTAAHGTNTTQIATTEFVQDEISLALVGYGNIVLLSVIEVTS